MSHSGQVEMSHPRPHLISEACHGDIDCDDHDELREADRLKTSQAVADRLLRASQASRGPDMTQVRIVHGGPSPASLPGTASGPPVAFGKRDALCMIVGHGFPGYSAWPSLHCPTRPVPCPRDEWSSGAATGRPAAR